MRPLQDDSGAVEAAKDGRLFRLAATAVTAAAPTAVGFATAHLSTGWQIALIATSAVGGYLAVPFAWAVVCSVRAPIRQRDEARREIGRLSAATRPESLRESFRAMADRLDGVTHTVRAERPGLESSLALVQDHVSGVKDGRTPLQRAVTDLYMKEHRMDALALIDAGISAGIATAEERKAVSHPVTVDEATAVFNRLACGETLQENLRRIDVVTDADLVPLVVGNA